MQVFVGQLRSLCTHRQFPPQRVIFPNKGYGFRCNQKPGIRYNVSTIPNTRRVSHLAVEEIEACKAKRRRKLANVGWL